MAPLCPRTGPLARPYWVALRAMLTVAADGWPDQALGTAGINAAGARSAGR